MGQSSDIGPDANLEAILSRAGDPTAAIRVEGRKAEVWEAVERRVSAGRGGKSHIAWRLAWRVAAAVIPLAMVALTLISRGAADETALYAATERTDTFALPDGSVVVLGKGSQLAFTNGGKSRKAKLTGIGLFMVRHDEKCPFAVRSGEAEVRVLGTTFSVEHWPGEERVRTRVEQGHVMMEAGSGSVSLLAGEEATWDDGKLQKLASASGPVRIGSREMTFHKASLAQVVEELKTCYHGELKGVDFRCSADSVLITTSFKDQTLASVVEELNMHFDKKLTLHNGYLTISD